ncbi:competence protein ComEC [Limimaricola soesokkakensis]|uniref:ComEC family competence protein n=1 Tax=Limimaricola soesokkakensis TaxID=1343159 RepID=A0A1X6YY05_9RHOB|nr:ComEC/Rec2 family competence protein [Limimaricola soesokkakensis]PSK87841.1 competence protein ComEC [Limimaricola soesokkakensis]SLN35029.1 ComEC family competence protein [Limimaricola soesokkakensis]
MGDTQVGARKQAWPKRAAPDPLAGFEGVLARQRGHLACWAPVCLGLGIGIWFALTEEPGAGFYGTVAGTAGLCVAAWGLLRHSMFRVLAAAGLLVCGGLLLAGARAHGLSAPVLGFRYYGPIEGRIVDIDRSQSDRLRITLDRVRLDDVRRRPARVRLSLHGEFDTPLAPGARVMTTGHLSPPPGPAEPGGFDFRRHAWFARLGAVGYSRVPVLLGSEAGAEGAWLARLRVRLSAAMRARVAGEAGGFAAAVTTGDRSGLGRAANDAMREANLYHLVSISGMHMAMLAGFVFWLVRTVIAAVPPLALRLDARKIAAAAALPASAFYLALAGRDVATERAFVMVAVSLGAVLLDRRALSLRGLAIAALIVLGLRPETLLNPGFQMSFAAVLALVAVMGRLPPGWHRPRGLARLWMPVALLSLTSLVAGSATAPFAAAHFNRVAHYGLLANLLAVPAMGGLVMPGAVILAVTGPLGLDQPATWMIDYGSRWILFVSERIAALDGASSAVIAPPGAVVPLVALGGLWMVLWRGRGRVAAMLPLALAAGLWARAERPDLLVSDSGALLGLMTPEGRALSKPNGDGFAASAWLENDGDGRDQQTAHDPTVLPRTDRVLRLDLGGTRIVQVTGKTALAALQGCDGADILIANQRDTEPRPCLRYDARRLRDTGALAIRNGPGGLRIETVAERAGRRLWTRAQ